MAGRSRLLMFGLPLAGLATFGLASLSIIRSNFAGTIQTAATAEQPGPAAAVQTIKIAGLGTIEPPGRQTDISARIAGVVTDVRVAPGDKVNPGDVLFETDRAVAAATIEQRRRDLAIAEERLAETKAKFVALHAEVEAVRSVLAGAETEAAEAADLVRSASQLNTASTITERESTRRRNALQTADARVAEIKARLVRAEAERDLVDPEQNGATIRIEKATIDQARAALALAETEAELNSVKAPIAATVLAVNVRVGEYANPAAPSAPVVLGQLDPLHVRVEIDEADVPRFSPQFSAHLWLRGEPRISLPLRFVRVEPQITPKRALTGTDAERVDTRVLQIIYAVDRPAVRLWPGQLVDVIIEGARSDRRPKGSDGATSGNAQ